MSDVVPPLNGRRAEAARNDEQILESAREVFLADPGAPISAVAAHAGVGISALYRRYQNKQHLLQELARDGLTRFKADLEIALADDGDAWSAYSGCLGRVLDGQSQGLAQRIAGTFTPTPELTELAAETGELYARLHRRTQHAKALRNDVTAADVVVLLELVMLVDLGGPARAKALRRRYLTLLLQSLHTSSRAPLWATLPGPPASDAELGARWTH